MLKALEARALARLDTFHRVSAERPGMPREELRQRLGEPPERVFAQVVSGLLESKKVELVDELLRLPGRGRAFTEAAAAHQAQLAGAAGDPPALPAHPDRAGVGAAPASPRGSSSCASRWCPRARRCAPASSSSPGAPSPRLHGKLLAYFATHEKLSTQAFKELTGLCRKFLIPLAEYFDREKVTLRVGDERMLRRRARADLRLGAAVLVLGVR